jgi:hypothetical protein
MTETGKKLQELHARLGYKPLNRGWAKVEILFGLAATGISLVLGGLADSQQLPPVETAVVALMLFVLGTYLALAGHRSHVYQSANELTAFLAEEIQRTQQKG